jgi:hypothetical protein
MPADGAAAASGDGYYYDNDDAFNFYLELWGGENLHVGIYDGTEKVCPEECGKASDKVPGPKKKSPDNAIASEIAVPNNPCSLLSCRARSPPCSPTTGGAGQLSRILRAGAGEAPGVLHPCSQVRSPTRPLCDFVGAGNCNCTPRCMLRSLVEVTSPSEHPGIVSWRAVRSQRGREARHGHGLSLRRLRARDGEEVRLRRLPPPLLLPSLTPAHRLLQTRTRRALASRTRHHPPSAHALSATHPTALRHAHAIVKDILRTMH